MTKSEYAHLRARESLYLKQDRKFATYAVRWYLTARLEREKRVIQRILVRVM